MITQLTKAQEKKVPVYLNKWLKTGLRTKTTDRKKARQAFDHGFELASDFTKQLMLEQNRMLVEQIEKHIGELNECVEIAPESICESHFANKLEQALLDIDEAINNYKLAMGDEK